MCGKFSQTYSWREVHAFSQPLTVPAREIANEADGGETDETVTPMRRAKVLHLDEAGERVASAMQWGWPDPSGLGRVPKFMHARAETIDTRPTFRESFAQRRGLIFVNHFNEGEEVTPTRTQQWVITPQDAQPIAIGVIYQMIAIGEMARPAFVMVTTEPNVLIAKITDRMPAIIRPEHFDLWLGETDEPLDHVKAALQTFDDQGNWTMEKQKPPAKPRRELRPKPDAEPGLL